jgi:5'-3' exonuclease
MALDSASLYFRAFFGVPQSIKAPDGTPVNAIRGFLDMMATLVSRFSPDDLVACLDFDWRPAWRVELLPSYKAHRVANAALGIEETPDALEVQVPVILDFLAAFGIAAIGVRDYEADDVIGTLATRYDDVAIVTGDRDLFQLIDDDRRVRVLYTGKGVAKLEIFDDAVVRAKYGIPAALYADLAVLRGDPSDGLPGLAGVGEKTAAGLLTRFGSLTELLAALDAGEVGLGATHGAKLAAGRAYLAAAAPVVRVARELPLPEADIRLPRRPANPKWLAELAEKWGVQSSVQRLATALSTVD